VEKGFAKNANTISAGISTLWGRNLVPSTADPKLLMQIMAYGISNTEALASGHRHEPTLCADRAGGDKILAEGGYTKRGRSWTPIKTARVTTHEAIFAGQRPFGRVNRTFEAERRRPGQWKVRTRQAAAVVPQARGWEEVETVPAVGMLEFIVCGDASRNKVQILAGGPGNAIKEIRLPARWDELMEKAGYRPLKDFALP
jgi:hypothetical protein